MNTLKSPEVKIIQIVVKENGVIFGLGNDSLIYGYDPDGCTWMLYEVDDLTN